MKKLTILLFLIYFFNNQCAHQELGPKKYHMVTLEFKSQYDLKRFIELSKQHKNFDAQSIEDQEGSILLLNFGKKLSKKDIQQKFNYLNIDEPKVPMGILPRITTYWYKNRRGQNIDEEATDEEA